MVITSLQLLQMVVGCVVNYTAYTFKKKGQTFPTLVFFRDFGNFGRFIFAISSTHQVYGFIIVASVFSVVLSPLLISVVDARNVLWSE